MAQFEIDKGSSLHSISLMHIPGKIRDEMKLCDT